MTAFLGTVGVGLGLVGAIGGAATLVMALSLRRSEQNQRVFWWVGTMTAGCVIAVLAMEVGLLTDNFSMQYVAANSTRATPWLYKVATLWGALEGSLLLWALVLSGYVAAVSISLRRRIEDSLDAWAHLTMKAACAVS